MTHACACALADNMGKGLTTQVLGVGPGGTVKVITNGDFSGSGDVERRVRCHHHGRHLAPLCLALKVLLLHDLPSPRSLQEAQHLDVCWDSGVQDM